MIGCCKIQAITIKVASYIISTLHCHGKKDLLNFPKNEFPELPYKTSLVIAI